MALVDKSDKLLHCHELVCCSHYDPGHSHAVCVQPAIPAFIDYFSSSEFLGSLGCQGQPRDLKDSCTALCGVSAWLLALTLLHRFPPVASCCGDVWSGPFLAWNDTSPVSPAL